MRNGSFHIRLFTLMAVVLAICLSLGGCSLGDASFSKEEMQQLKQGPPKEMPPEARKMIQEMQSGANKPYQPPKTR